MTTPPIVNVQVRKSSVATELYITARPQAPANAPAQAAELLGPVADVLRQHRAHPARATLRRRGGLRRSAGGPRKNARAICRRGRSDLAAGSPQLDGACFRHSNPRAGRRRGAADPLVRESSCRPACPDARWNFVPRRRQPPGRRGPARTTAGAGDAPEGHGPAGAGRRVDPRHRPHLDVAAEYPRLVRPVQQGPQRAVQEARPAQGGRGGQDAGQHRYRRGAAGAGGLRDGLLRPDRQPAPRFLLASGNQDAASKYNSAFSRAAVAATPAGDTLYISGTAAIDASGQTTHIGDISGQIDDTVANVQAVLRNASCGPADTVAAIAYCKTPEVERAFRHGWGSIHAGPFIIVVADVCRHNLLFEIELTAMRV